MSTNKSNNPRFLNRIFVGLLVCYIISSPLYVKAIGEVIDLRLEAIVSFDDVPVDFVVNSYLKFETNVIITESNKVYIDIDELFENLGVKCTSINKGDNLTGFIENESKTYGIDFKASEITIGNKKIKALNGFMKESGEIYIESTVLTEAFGFDILFNFRSLSIKMDANFELPILKQMRLEQMRQNVSKLQSKNEVLIDTILGRNYHLFEGGALDWSVSSSQAEGEKTSNRFSLGLGSELLFGEAKVAFNYYDQTKFDKRQLYYNWRWVDNDNNYIKQAQLGKIGSQTIAFLGAPLVGASFNNSPNTIRKATGTYTISEYTEPNWTVELYINDALVDYTEADASGLYVFEVPIVYGYTSLKLKFYGPLGEERIEEKNMNTPYTLMPAKVLEYKVSGGILEDDDGSEFGRGEVNYGFNRFLTIGGGVEYLSSIADNPLIPFANISFQPFSRMMINMEYAHNVSLKGLFNYNLGRSAFLELDYSKYVEGQQATLNNANEERKVRLSLPFKIEKININTKLSFNQYVYNDFNFNQLDALLSGRYKNYSANASIASNWLNDREAYMTSTFVFSRRMRNGFIIRPILRYSITDGNAISYRAEIEKKVDKMSFSASYERNIQYATNNVFVSFKYDLPFARTSVSASSSKNKICFSESAQGSLAFGDKTVKAGNNSALGKGGILFYPFVDLNQNGSKEKNEPMVFIPNARVLGGKAITSEKDSIIRISNLNSFINYTIEFSDNDLDNIAWKFKYNTYQVLVDPNQYKKVFVPVLSLGEVSGMVYLKKGDNMNGQGRVTVQIYDIKGNQVAETLSESDGYFTYLGLKPGDYTVHIDEKQLEKLGYQSAPLLHNFLIRELIDGDYVDGLELVLQSPTRDTSISKVTVEEEKMLATTNSDAKDKAICLIQVGEFNHKADAIAAQKQLKEVLGYSGVIVYEGDIYKVLIGKFESSKEIESLAPQLVAMGYSDAIIVLVDAYGEINKYELMNRGVFAVQLGAFAKKSNALVLRSRLSWISDKIVAIEHEDGLYKVRFNYFYGRKAAKNFIVKLLDQGFSELIIVSVEHKRSF